MNKQEFSQVRKILQKTQKQMAELLGTSLKAVHSYEQGWRNIPVHVERQLLFLLMQKRRGISEQKPCWTIKKCPKARRQQCPAWEFSAGTLCWFINGTLCKGSAQKSWHEKMNVCRSCKVLSPLNELYHRANSNA